MEKYIGILKEEMETAIGVDIKILTKFSNSKKELMKCLNI